MAVPGVVPASCKRRSIDRWEEDPGYSPFTLAVEVAALLCAAELADVHEPDVAGYLRETADAWNSAVERWTYASGGDLAQRAGVDGYYVRIAPPESVSAPSPTLGYVPIKNRPPGQSTTPASHIISPDALALVRFGLRAADDRSYAQRLKPASTAAANCSIMAAMAGPENSSTVQYMQLCSSCSSIYWLRTACTGSIFKPVGKELTFI